MRLMIMPIFGLTLLLGACAHPCPDGLCPFNQPSQPGPAASLDAAMHDYLLAHGDVVLQALQDNQKRQQTIRIEQSGKMIAENRRALFDDSRDPVAGNPHGDVVIVEYFDPECPYCKKVAPDLEKLLVADNGVKLVYKEFPILGPMSVTAARTALASRAQGKYEAFHNALMHDQTAEHQLTEAHIMEIAAAVGLNLPRLTSDMQAPEIQAQLDATIELARKIGITGTPGLIIGDKLTPGAMTFDALKEAVADTRTRKTAASQ